MFPLPAERCRGLAGDIASFFTVPMAMLIHLNRKEVASPLTAKAGGFHAVLSMMYCCREKSL